MKPWLYLSVFLTLAATGGADEAPAQSAAPRLEGSCTPDQQYAAGQKAVAAGDYAAALTHFLAAEEQGYAAVLLHYELGRVYERLGRYEEARARFSRFAVAQQSASRPEPPPTPQAPAAATEPGRRAKKTSPPPQPPAGVDFALTTRRPEAEPPKEPRSQGAREPGSQGAREPGGKGDTEPPSPPASPGTLGTLGTSKKLPTVRPSTLATHPQYQIALIHLKRQQYPAALEALCRYLEEVPHAANRSEVEQTIQRLEQAIKEGGGAETAGPAGSAAADSEGTAAAPGDPGENGRRAVPPVLDRATAKALARHVRAAVKQAEAQDLPGARAEFEQALSTAPGAPVKVRSKAWLTYLALGQALYDAGRLAEALAAYQEVLARQPPSDATAATHSLIGQIHLDQQQWEAAETDCEAALQADPNLTLAHLSLGRARLRQGRVEEALPPLQRAVQLAPDEPMTHFNLALAMQGLDRLDEAAAAYREVIRLQPDVPEPHNNLALLLKRQGRWEEAIAEYRAAIQLSPDDPVARSNLAAALYQRGRLEEAAVEYRAILERQPREVLARCMLGRLLARQGKLDEALAELREGVRVAPNHPLPHNTLAWFHLMAPREPYRDLAAGLEEARKAVELAPENAYCLGTLGLACYRNGDYAASLQWTHRGLDASTDVDARALNLYLGSMAQAQLSNLDPAGKLYQAAVATDPNHEFRAEAEALLAKR